MIYLVYIVLIVGGAASFLARRREEREARAERLLMRSEGEVVGSYEEPVPSSYNKETRGEKLETMLIVILLLSGAWFLTSQLFEKLSSIEVFSFIGKEDASKLLRWLLYVAHIIVGFATAFLLHWIAAGIAMTIKK